MRSTWSALVRLAMVAALAAVLTAGCDLLFPRFQGGSATPAPSGSVPCGLGEPACGPPHGTIQLTVRETSGDPIQSFSVTYEDPAGSGGEIVFQGAQGHGDVDVPIGPLTLTISAPGHGGIDMPVSLGEGEVRPLTVMLPLAP